MLLQAAVLIAPAATGQYFTGVQVVPRKDLLDSAGWLGCFDRPSRMVLLAAPTPVTVLLISGISCWLADDVSPGAQQGRRRRH
jgi:hypothetical protein